MLQIYKSLESGLWCVGEGSGVRVAAGLGACRGVAREKK